MKLKTTDQWIMRLCNIDTMKYYSTKKMKPYIHVCIQTNLEMTNICHDKQKQKSER